MTCRLIPLLLNGFIRFSAGRSQQVKVNGFLSGVKPCTGTSQSCVSSSILFILFTNEYRSTIPNNYINLSDNTAILSLHAYVCPLIYHRETATCKDLCDNQPLILTQWLFTTLWMSNWVLTKRRPSQMDSSCSISVCQTGSETPLSS